MLNRRRLESRKVPSATAPDRCNGKPPELGPVDSVLGFHVKRASFVFAPSAKSARGLPRWELTILSVISANPGISQIALSKTLNIDQGNLIPQLNGLIKRGLLIKMVPAADRRVRRLTLTTAGDARLDQVLSMVRKAETQMLRGLSQSERKTLLDLLRRVHTPFGEPNPLVVRALRRDASTP
jgi:DNA-binding MarR family transcriptional regulator